LPWLVAGMTAISFYSLVQRSSTRVKLDKTTIQATQAQSAGGNLE